PGQLDLRVAQIDQRRVAPFQCGDSNVQCKDDIRSIGISLKRSGSDSAEIIGEFVNPDKAVRTARAGITELDVNFNSRIQYQCRVFDRHAEESQLARRLNVSGNSKVANDDFGSRRVWSNKEAIIVNAKR